MQAEAAIRVTTKNLPPDHPPDHPPDRRPDRQPVLVVMAKAPTVGQVKTRLIGALTGEQAMAVHKAMLDCVLQRLGAIWPVPSTSRCILAMNGADDWALPGLWQRLEQGSGDLGQRMGYVWQWIGSGPAVFLGTDSPDLPIELIQSACGALRGADAALGPVEDGGYWALAAKQPHRALLENIDWGTDRVYHQSVSAARQADLQVLPLPPWYDVDSPADLAALRQRIAGSDDPALMQLRERLDQVCGDSIQ